MADGLSVVASIAGLIEIAGAVAHHCYEYVKDVKGAKTEISKLLDGTTELFGILHGLHLAACRFDGEDFDSTTQTHHIFTYYSILERIRSRLDEENPSHYSNKRKALLKKLKWPFSKTETRDMLVDLGKQNSTLSLALSADSM